MRTVAPEHDSGASPDNGDNGDNDAVWLGLGKQGAHAVAARPHARRAAALVSTRDAPDTIASVVVDVDIADQVAWLARALPGRPRLVVARKPGRAATVDAPLRAAAAAAGLTAVIVDVAHPGEAVPAIAAALAAPGGKATLLLVPDDAVVTADTIAPLMQSAYAARVPVVGFSAYFQKVGAVAVLKSDAARAVREAVALATGTCTPSCPHVASSSARLVVDGRLAERLGFPIGTGPHVEVLR